MKGGRVNKNSANSNGDGLMSFREFLAEAEEVSGEKRNRDRWKPNALEAFRHSIANCKIGHQK